MGKHYYFKASMQNTLSPEVGSFTNEGSKTGVFTLEDNEYYLTNTYTSGYGHYLPEELLDGKDYIIEFDIYNPGNTMGWFIGFRLFEDYCFWGINCSRAQLDVLSRDISSVTLTTVTNKWLHIKIDSKYTNGSYVRSFYVDGSFISEITYNKRYNNSYNIPYIDVLGRSSSSERPLGGRIKNIAIYEEDSSIPDETKGIKYLDLLGLNEVWTNIKSWVLAQLSDKANDSNVVHKSGAETVNGIKSFTSALYALPKAVGTHGYLIKVPFNRGDTENTEGTALTGTNHATFRVVDKDSNIISEFCTENYVNGKAAQIFNIRNANDNGNQVQSSINHLIDKNAEQDWLYPSRDNKVMLGTLSNKWADVKTVLLNGKTPAYANDIPTKTSELTNDSNFVIEGGQFNYNTPYFYGPTTYYYGINMADEALRLYSLERGVYHETVLEARYLSEGQEVYKSYLSLATNSEGQTTIQWNGKVDNDIIPKGNVYTLGSSTNKWADTNTTLINGIVPNILGFPNSTKYQDIDFSSFVYDFNTANTFIAPCTGNIRIICNNTNAVTDYQFNTSSGYFERERATSIKYLSRTFPVIEGDTVTIKIAGGAIINLIAYKARGL